MSTEPNAPFLEIVDHCQALLMGKQQKLDVFLNSQQRQEILLIGSTDIHDLNASPSVQNDQLGGVISIFHSFLGILVPSILVPTFGGLRGFIFLHFIFLHEN